MIIKILVNNDLRYIINSDDCSEISKKVINFYKEARRKNKKIRICEGTHEEWENHVKEWDELMDLMEDDDG